MALNMTKVAYGHDSLPDLKDRIDLRKAQGALVLTTRYLPKRHEEMSGGSLYWIIRHQLVARSPLIGFGEAEGGRVAIHLRPELVLVQGQPKRAHQGWRYLEDADAPPDLDKAGADIAAMPPDMIGELSALALI
ncbi:DUF1489 domain-containing protein [Stakelama sp. CBK3Z-3]|uniref:DUF1489 domain-containing protein n=1 Tax=Stakelama flava TaxID=2860338 RepID=A0ABS6XMW6_9SPHN|nr:DUF1489 domain-containing protein [Stakelama flava]MBW4330751.1 DUF1489 domain-containing protein [Stakelama flava]